MDISFVVPVYNTEKYLRECVESLLKQSGKIEILLIDNKSTDNSLSICKEYEKKDKRVKVLSCENPGAGAVRNFGIKKARGEYVWFVDSDDYLHENATKKALTKMKNGADIIMVSAEEVFESNPEKKMKLPAIKPEKNWRHIFLRYGSGPWQFLIRRKWFIENELWFHEGIIHEDMAIIPTYILYIEKYDYISDTVYYYRQREDSVLHQTKWNPHCKDIYEALKDVYGKFAKEGKLTEYKDDIEYFFIWNLLSDSARDFMKFPEGKVELPKMRKFLYGHFPKWRKNKYYKEKPFMVRLRCELNYRGVKI